MSSRPHPQHQPNGPGHDALDSFDEHVFDLLVERALWGLDEQTEASLREHVGQPTGAAGDAAAAYRSSGVDAFDHAVASCAVAYETRSGSDEALPEGLLRSLRDRASAFAAGDLGDDTRVAVVGQADAPAPLPMRAPADAAAKVPLRPAASARPAAWLGWIAAAACLVFAFVAAMPQRGVTLRERVAALESSAGDVVRAGWVGISAIGADDHPLDRGVGGEVVWSDSRDEGYMRISGIEPNDPGEFQYQLWIFDAERPTGDLPRFRAEGLPEILTQRPVDGGVFDVASSGEVIVPVDAKLPVGQGVIFAVTKERPGGVVVSDRDIVFLALRG